MFDTALRRKVAWLIAIRAIIGSALLLLSAYWHQARRLIVTRLPSNLQDRLPQLDRPAVITQPAA